MGHFAVSKAYV